MEGEESLLDSIYDVDNVEDTEDIEMVDVEEGELVGKNHQAELVQNSSVDVDAVAQEPHCKNLRLRNKKKNKKKKAISGSGITDINRFVLDTCRRLKERKSYLVWTAVAILGVSALSDLVTEVDAIQSCGGQKTADGRRYRTCGGILWSILKSRDPNAYKEIMKKGKEFEKQFKPNQKKPTCSETEEVKPVVEETQKRPVQERIRVPVSYDDLIEVEDPKDG